MTDAIKLTLTADGYQPTTVTLQPVDTPVPPVPTDPVVIVGALPPAGSSAYTWHKNVKFASPVTHEEKNWNALLASPAGSFATMGYLSLGKSIRNTVINRGMMTQNETSMVTQVYRDGINTNAPIGYPTIFDAFRNGSKLNWEWNGNPLAITMPFPDDQLP